MCAAVDDEDKVGGEETVGDGLFPREGFIHSSQGRCGIWTTERGVICSRPLIFVLEDFLSPGRFDRTWEVGNSSFPSGECL
jgi:hypothetical protein